jgi:hypothetical protein
MSFIRPEAREAIWRWREVIAGVFLALLGGSWAVGPGGLLGWLGWALTCIGAAVTVIGIQRARFRLGAGGPGVVQVDEGQIAYFGPLTGGAMAARDLDRLVLDHTAQPAHWVLEIAGQAPLLIPVNAEGSEALFDAFATLPGLRTERMLVELRKSGPHQVVIWERRPRTVPVHRLH